MISYIVVACARRDCDVFAAVDYCVGIVAARHCDGIPIIYREVVVVDGDGRAIGVVVEGRIGRRLFGEVAHNDITARVFFVALAFCIGNGGKNFFENVRSSSVFDNFSATFVVDTVNQFGSAALHQKAREVVEVIDIGSHNPVSQFVHKRSV